LRLHQEKFDRKSSKVVYFELLGCYFAILKVSQKLKF